MCMNCKVLTSLVVNAIRGSECDAEARSAYAEDIDEFGVFLEGVCSRHGKRMSGKAYSSILRAASGIREIASKVRNGEKLDAGKAANEISDDVLGVMRQVMEKKIETI